MLNNINVMLMLNNINRIPLYWFSGSVLKAPEIEGEIWAYLDPSVR